MAGRSAEGWLLAELVPSGPSPLRAVVVPQGELISESQCAVSEAHPGLADYLTDSWRGGEQSFEEQDGS